MTPDEMITMGDEARRVLENDAFRAALSMLAEAGQEAFRQATTPEAAWDARLQILMAEDVAAALQTFVVNGETAAKALLAEQAELRSTARVTADLEQYRLRAQAEREAWQKRTSPGEGG